jgi:hypothetical protein
VVILPIITWFVRETTAHSDPKFVGNKHQIQESIKFYLLLNRTTNQNDAVIALVVPGTVRQRLVDRETKANEVK